MKIEVIKATDGPLRGRWKAYIDDKYVGSGPDKLAVRNMAKDMAKQMKAAKSAANRGT